jgi:nucleoside-diphosphate-sugar epimerase
VAEVVWHHADLLAPGAPESLVARVQPAVVLHFAWNVTPGEYWTSEQNHAWRAATAALARAHFEAGGRRFVGAGTCAEYDWSAGLCDELTTPLEPATLYGEAKLGAWHDVAASAAAAPRAGATAAWGRVFWMFGGDEHAARLVPSVARALLAGKPALCTHGEQLRDFLHVDDVAGAFVALVTSNVEGAVNIASGQPHLVRDVIYGIATRVGRPDLVRLGARPTTDPPVVTATTVRLANEVGWRPTRTFEQALEEAAGEI